MEFLQTVPSTGLNSDSLKQLATIKNLPVLCASIDTIISQAGDKAEIYCLWGEFSLRRDEIRHGVRFSLLNCPHALAWTVTFDKEYQRIIIHCTIDKSEQEQDFIDSIHEFVDDWVVGLGKPQSAIV